MKIVVIVMVFVVGCQCQNFVMPDVYVKEGDDAVIPCQWESEVVVSGVPTIKWYIREESGSRKLIYTFKKGNGDATRKSGSLNRDYYANDDGALVLYDTTLQDNADFGALECEKDYSSTDDGQAVSQTGQTTLKVVVLAKKDPTIAITHHEFQSGKNIPTEVGTCTTDFVYPKPVVKILKEGEEVDVAGDEDTAEDNSDDPFGIDFQGSDVVFPKDGKFSVKKTFIRTLTKEDDKAIFYCYVEIGGGGNETSQKQKVQFSEFRVKYPTDMVHFIDPPKHVFAGVETELSCGANGYPAPTINLDDTPDVGDVNTVKMTFQKSDDKRVLTCSASNPPNDSPNVVTTSYTVDVKYADTPKIEGDNKKIAVGENLSLMCMGNSKPKPMDTYWEKGGGIASDSGDLTIPKVNFSHSGIYTCIVENKYDILTKRVNSSNIEVVGVVLEKNSEDVRVSGEMGSTVSMTCDVQAVPKPTLTWTYVTKGSESKELVTDTNMETLGNHKYRSTITVGPLDSKISKRVYTCTATNSESSSDQTKNFILPEIKSTDKGGDGDSELSAASPTAGIIIGILVAVLVIVVVLVVLARKGIICSKKENGEEDAKDIAMKMNEDEEAAQPRNNYTETDHKVSENDQQLQGGEQDRLMNGTGDE